MNEATKQLKQRPTLTDYESSVYLTNNWPSPSCNIRWGRISSSRRSSWINNAIPARTGKKSMNPCGASNRTANPAPRWLNAACREVMILIETPDELGVWPRLQNGSHAQQSSRLSRIAIHSVTKHLWSYHRMKIICSGKKSYDWTVLRILLESINPMLKLKLTFHGIAVQEKYKNANQDSGGIWSRRHGIQFSIAASAAPGRRALQC
jgi:hypothetical protein